MRSTSSGNPRGFVLVTLAATFAPPLYNDPERLLLTLLNSHKEMFMSKPASSDLKVGQKAPDFTVLNDIGEKVKLSNFKGKKVVLYFYPKDDTPGCTKEACAFRDGIDEIKQQGAVVIGVSVDSVETHKKFKSKFDLNFPLLADTDKKVVEAYGTWREKSMYGRKYMGIERTTFVIDEQGKISHIFPKVKVDEHYDEVLEALSR